jgi:hypothetical protein
MQTQMWCKECKTWFAKYEGCPGCGYRGTGFNKYLRTAQLNAHLYSTSERVHKEHTDQAHFVRQAKLEQKRFTST